MGRGASKAGGGTVSGGRTATALQDQRNDLIADLAVALNKKVAPDSDEYPMSNSDMESAVEAFAMTHRGVDENAMIDAVRNRAELLQNLDGVTSTTQRTLILQRSPEYIGNQNMTLRLLGDDTTSRVKTPKGYHVSKVNNFMIDSNPDAKGFADVWVKYTISNQKYSGGKAVGTGKTKNMETVIKMKILK